MKTKISFSRHAVLYLTLFLLSISLINSYSNSTKLSSEEAKELIKIFNSSNFMVHDLDSSDFDQFNQTTSHYFLEFYADWCQHCQSLIPIYEEAAVRTHVQKIPCQYAKVNGGDPLAERFGIKHYPTIFWVDNKEKTVTPYTGEREVAAFLKFSKLKLGVFNVEEITKYEQLEKFMVRDEISNILIIGLGENQSNETYTKEIKNLYLAGTDFNYDPIFIVKKGSEIFSKINVDFTENFAVFSLVFDKIKKTYYPAEKVLGEISDFSTEDKANKVLSHYRFKIYGSIDNQEMNYLIEKGDPSLILFTEDNYNNLETKSKHVNDFMRELAIKYRRDLHVYHSQIGSAVTSVVVEVLRIKKKDLPCLLLTQSKPGSTNIDSDELNKYKIENVELTKEKVEEFITSWKRGEFKPFLASEDEPAKPIDKFGLHKIVGKTFDKFLTTQSKDLVLVVCSSYSKRCDKFKKRLNNIARKLAHNENLIIAQTDPNFNEYQVLLPPRFPSIYFFHSDSDNLNVKDRWDNRMVYNGEYTTKKISEFIVQNAQHSINVKPLENEDKIDQVETKEPIESKLDAQEDEEDFNFAEYISKQISEDESPKDNQGNVIDLASMFTVPKGKEGESEEEDDMSMDFPQDYDEEGDENNDIMPQAKNSKVKDSKNTKSEL
jgi:protein disulfide isomerase